MAWLAGFDNRAEITIDSSKIDSSLTDFPVFISIGSSTGLTSRDLTQLFDDLVDESNILKIAVTSSDGTTQLYVELEWYDFSAEELGLHVKVPSILSSVDTTLYIYWDVTASDNTTYVSDTISVSQYTLSGGSVSVEDVSTGSAANLVDGDKSGGSFWEIASGAYPTWCKYDFGSGNSQVVNAYAFHAGDSEPGRMPKTFYIQGSDNDSDWTTLDPVTKNEFNWATSEERIFYNDNSTAYRYYRVYMTAGNSSVLRVFEWELLYVTQPTPVQNVWDSNFKVVQHMNPLPYDGLWDSTGNKVHGHDHRSDNAGDRVAGPTTGSRARDLDGNNTGQDCDANLSETSNLGTYTLECMGKPHSFGQGNAGRMIMKDNTNTGYAMFLDGANGVLGYLHGGTGTLGQWGGATITLNVWAHCAVTMDSSSTSNNPSIYKDGVSGSVTEYSTPTGTLGGGEDELYLGTRLNGLTTLDRNYNGLISEIRISDTERSAAWLLATTHTLKDTLLSIGAAEAAPVVGEQDKYWPSDAANNHQTADVFMNVPGGDSWFEVVTCFEKTTSFDILNDWQQDFSWDILKEFMQDTSWDVINEFAISTAWDILNDATKDTSWDILNDFTKDTAWDILNEFAQSIAWDILNVFEQDFSWNIFAATAPYIQNFLIDYVKRNFDVQILNLNHKICPVTTNFVLQSEIDTSVSIAPIFVGTNHDIEYITTSFSIKEKLQTNFEVTRVFNKTRTL
jgi:hypothetical protein